MPGKTYRGFLALILTLLSPWAIAQDGRILATGGVTQIEGSAGGGLVPWAVMAGYGAEGEQGGTVSLSHVSLADYRLSTVAANWSWNNRVEVSASRGQFNLGTLGIALEAPDAVLRMNTLGLKTRLGGDLIYGTLPQIAFGVQYKDLRDPTIPELVGAQRDSDVDAYLAVTRLFLGGAGGYNLLLNGTLRATRANELGYLGFGGDRNDDHELQLEASAAIFLNPRTAVGMEYRRKPNNLSFAEENDWADLFIAWFPNKDLALAAAWTRHGAIAGLENQDGFYLSLQASF
ncbi:DUF3034 family protein [Natronospira bacteriovora]|uniref:DUF3034 family protein n=1 Tax=Natronospira bacteriovora TaxID=3069753 RepID=A0ABU0W717_9GAMM|nr:DUF3034 family protein [Natronospira sp. AB-CW4]MDQ2069713.1 DUF3034 family protein [Natronospira sp. AB-CW4]